MIAIGEIRQKLEAAKANYKGNDPAAFANTIDDAVASLQAQYGDQVPAVAAVRFLRELPLPADEMASGPGATAIDTNVSDTNANHTKKTPDGVSIQWTPAGFLLRAANGSWIAGLDWLVFVAVLGAIPFIVFPDLLSSLFECRRPEPVAGYRFSDRLVRWRPLRPRHRSRRQLRREFASPKREPRVRSSPESAASAARVVSAGTISMAPATRQWRITPMRASGAPAISSACMGLPAASSPI